MASNKPFQGSPDQTDNCANYGNQVIDFFHVPTGNSVKFKAFLTQFDDVYSSEWNSENAYGRMDPIQSFQRTGRKISIGFDVVAGSYDEAASNLQRISRLIQMLYPSYDGGASATAIQAAPYFKLNFMNLASNTMVDGTSGAESSGLLGTVDGFTYSPNVDVGFFQSADSLSAKVVNISCTFTVLHQNQLGWVKKTPRSGFDNFPYQEYPEFDDSKPLSSQFEMPITKTARKLDYADEDMAKAAAERLTLGRGSIGDDSFQVAVDDRNAEIRRQDGYPGLANPAEAAKRKQALNKKIRKRNLTLSKGFKIPEKK